MTEEEGTALVMNGHSRIVVHVDPLVRDLIPVYLKNRRADIGLIRAALERGDFGTIYTLGHNMHGSGASFGFDAVSVLGAELERAAEAQKFIEITRLVRQIEDYFSRVDVAVTARDVKPEAPEAGPAVMPVAVDRADAIGRPGEILVVDDQEMNAAIICRYLTREGYQVKYLASGDQALTALDKGPLPALILLDVVMAGTNGFDVCRRIKADPATCSIPVVLVTSFDSRRDFVQGWAAGADDVLAKPVQRNELVERVRTLLRPAPGATLPKEAAAPSPR